MNITIDIETIPTQRREILDLVKGDIKAPANYKDPEKITHYIEERIAEVAARTALAPYGELICIGTALDDEKPFVFYREDSDSMAEKRLLMDWIAWLRSLDEPGRPAVPRFIGHNVIGFDIPRLWQRAIVHGLVLPSYFPAPWEVSKWKPHGPVLDTMYAFSPEQPLSLEMLATIFGIERSYPVLTGSEGEKPVTGADVCDLWLSAADGIIKDYCMEDVRVTREIAKRFLP